MTSLGNPQPSLANRPHRSAAGFTLFELLVVLAIMALTTCLIVGYRPSWSGSLGMRGAVSELASSLRLARSQAIANGGSVAMTVDVAAHRYRVGDGPITSLPPALKVELLTLASERATAAEGMIRFNPDGSSTGGRITVSNNVRSLAVGVDWLTGRVSIGDVR
ncbi:MAG TPA: GspH/FimT family pseudopilin [Stellaceae bacterium]|nr:GspH/FimT family pseudopilin [Stellaceae bacterium]